MCIAAKKCDGYRLSHILGWRDNDSNTLLHLAAQNNHLLLTKQIISNCSDLQEHLNQVLLSPNYYRKKPSDLATETETQNLLLWAEDQIGYYTLVSPPNVLVIYSTDSRPGFEEELESLTNTLAILSWPSVICKDPTENEVFTATGSLQKSDDVSAMVVVIMSHGERGSVWASDKLVPIRDILLQINPPSMNGKPKVKRINIPIKTYI